MNKVEKVLDEFEDKVDDAIFALLDGLVEEESCVHPVGWECPKCGRTYAPQIRSCGACAPKIFDWTVVPPPIPAWKGSGTDDVHFPFVTSVC